jgi:hypothetical protein
MPIVYILLKIRPYDNQNYYKGQLKLLNLNKSSANSNGKGVLDFGRKAKYIVYRKAKCIAASYWSDFGHYNEIAEQTTCGEKKVYFGSCFRRLRAHIW